MENPVLFGFSWLRSSLFTAESFLIPMADFFATGRKPRLPFSDLPLFLEVQRSLRKLLAEDVSRISRGFYPASVLLKGEPLSDPVAHLQRLPKLFQDSMAAARRRDARQTKAFGRGVKKKGLPAYYQRNFHFQKDGYLSEASADLYDHQVELLFAGAGDAMRRLLLAPMKRHFKRTNGKGLKILEIGCGAGSATRFLQLAFPEAKITAVDLSEPYLRTARKRVKGVRFLQANGEKLPFKAGAFDAVVSVFLFHELPLQVREQVLKESRRVMKDSGLMVYVDSLQKGDAPQLEEALRRFPREFHEPFYMNYVSHPMTELIRQAGFQVGERGLGFFAKVESAIPVREKRRKRVAGGQKKARKTR